MKRLGLFVFVAGWLLASLSGCGKWSSASTSYQIYRVGDTYPAAADHKGWRKWRELFSGPHGKYVKIFVNEAAYQVKENGGGFKPGAIVVKETFNAQDTTTIEKIYVMEKRAVGSQPRSNDWYWVVTDANGKVLEAGDDVKLGERRCAICHMGT